MLRPTIVLATAFALSACASRIDLPGTVLPPVEEAVAVAGMGPPEEWRPVDAETGRITDAEGLSGLLADFPESSSVRLRALGNAFGAQDTAATLDHVEWLYEREYFLSDGAMGQIRPFLTAGRPGADVEIAAMEAEAALNAVPDFETASIAIIPAEVSLPESVLRDDTNRRFLVTSIVSRGLFAMDDGEEWRSVPLANAGSLAGIALDAPRGLIWVGSGAVDPTPDQETAFRGVIGIDRITLEERRRVPAPEGVSISDIAVGPDGTVYGSDPVGGGIYSAAISDVAMETFIAPGTFRSPQGIAVRPDNSAFYVSDYRYGLAQVMVRTRQAYRMRAAEPMLLDGVDGLWLHGNELIAVQNGVSPHRITAFQLGQGIGVIASHRVLEMANPAWTEPLGGVIVGDSLYYIGTGQWDIWGEGGALNEGASPRVSHVHRLPLVQTPEE